LSPDVQKASRQLLRLLPDTYAIPHDTTPKDEQTAYIEPYHYSLLSQAFPSTRVAIKVKTCPSLSHAANTSSDSSASQDKGKGKEDTQDDGSEVEALVYLKADASVPPSSIWLSGAARNSLRLEGAAFELLQLSAIIRSGEKEYTKTGKDAQNFDTVPSHHKEPEEDVHAELAGFDKHVTKSLNFVEQAITSSKLSHSSSSPVSGLLICGGGGSGKTSLIEEIARRAQASPHILARTQRVKCAQLVNLRIPQLKSRLEDEFTAAAWHAPSLLVFDDLDHLIPAEVEHIDSFRSLHMANLFTSIASKAGRNGGITIACSLSAKPLLQRAYHPDRAR
jgi:peroxin-1